jgi:hypothetical protein
MLFARKHGFRSIGIDLSEEYCEDAARALKKLDGTETLSQDA